MYKDFIHIFVLSCTKATYLLEKKLHRKLNFIEKIQLRIHLSLCTNCTDYNKKAELLDLLTKVSVKENDNKSIFSPTEIENFKKKVKNKTRV